MKVNISGNISVGSSLPQYIEDKITKEVLKIFDGAIDANVSFLKEGHNRIIARIKVNEGSKRGVVIKSSAESDDAYSAFDLALTKIMRQLRKYKSKLRNYRKKIGDLKAKNSDLPYIIAERYIIEDEKLFEKEEVEEPAQEAEKINIIEEKDTEIEETTLQEALMKMDLLSLPAYMFLNKDNGRINVVYKRQDGKISWINPKK